MRRAAALLLAAAACGSPQLAGPGLPGGPPPDLKPSPSGRPVTLTIDPGGGVMSFGDLTLTVPAGAVGASTDFTIVALDPATVTATGKVGTAYEIGPADVVLAKPVTVTFAVADSTGLATSHQISLGYWLRSYDVSTTPTSVSVATTELGDWTLVTTATQLDLHGPFRIDSTTQEVPATFTGDVTLQYIGAEPGFLYYIPVGTVAVTAAGCDPAPPATLPWSLAEIHAADPLALQFRWAINGAWTLSCGGSSPFVSTGFDTMGIYNIGCTMGYTGAMAVSTGSSHLAGQFVIDCGTRGTVRASWDLVPPSGTPGPLPLP